MIVTDAELKREVVKDLVGLAMDINGAGIAYVFVNYLGHVDTVNVEVHPFTQAYDESIELEYLLNERVTLYRDSWLEDLHVVSTKLKEMQGVELQEVENIVEKEIG